MAPPVVHRRPADDDNTLTDLEILEAILAAPEIPALAGALPTVKSGGRGRPSMYPDVVFIISSRWLGRVCPIAMPPG